MSERKINLEEILLSKAKRINEVFPEFMDDILLAMKEACRQALELAAENAKVGMEYRDEDISFHTIVNKQSILSTIKQIE